MLLTALLIFVTVPADCEAFARQINTPVAISASPITAEQLAGSAVEALAPTSGVRSASKIGQLIYRGNGLELRSVDPRFEGIRVRHNIDFAHECGYEVRGPGGWNARDEKQTGWNLRFQRSPGGGHPPPGGTEMAKSGARPVLSGAVAGPSWPTDSGSRELVLGVMYPEGKPDESLIVAFAGGPDARSPRVLARVRMHVQGFSVVPALHSPTYYLNLHERTRDGALRHVVLELEKPMRERIASELER